MKLDTRNRLLLVGLALTFVLSYLAIKKTLALRHDYLTSQDQLELTINIPEQLHELSGKEKAIEAQFKEMDLGISSIQNSLVKFLNEASLVYNIKIVELKPPYIFHEDNSVSKTHSLKLEGNFNDLLKVVYALEQNGSFGAVSHFAFEKKRNYRSGKSHLEALIFLEYVE